MNLESSLDELRSWVLKHTEVPILFIVILTVVVLWWGTSASPLRGEVWLMVSEGELLPTVQAYELPSLTQVEFSYGADVEIATVVQKTLMFDATRAPDGAVAYLSKSKGVWQVFLNDQPLTTTPTVKRDLVFAPDGLSLAYAEISATSTPTERQNPDSWSVVRLLRSGDRLVVGHGIEPAPLVGRETAALTTRGIVSLSLDEEPILLVTSPTPVVRTTPFAVAPGGQHIAWINPGDKSLQVFERTPAKTYTPTLVKNTFSATSLVFSESGDALLATRTVGSETVLVSIALPDGAETLTEPLPLYATLSAWIQK